MNEINFKKLIHELEDKKWKIFLEKGDVAANEEWKIINSKLDRLYRWWSKEFGAQIKSFTPRKFK